MDDSIIQAAQITQEQEEGAGEEQPDPKLTDDTSEQLGEIPDEGNDESKEKSEDESEPEQKSKESKDSDESEDSKKEDSDEPEQEPEEEAGQDDSLTRKEKREARRQKFLDSVRKEDSEPQVQSQSKKDDEYEPLDYSKADQFEEEQLQKDRDLYGQTKYQEGVQKAAEEDKYWNAQKDFWKDVQHETKVLSYDKDLQFLNSDNKEEFDEDKASEINEMYLEMCGYKETPVFNADGAPVLDPSTNAQAINRTVSRTDVSYEKFAKRYVDNMTNWAEEKVADSSKNLAEQNSHTGIKPGGSGRKGLGALNPGDISKMSDEDFEKHEEEINRRIIAGLN